MNRKLKRWLVISGVTLVVIAAAGVAGLHFATQALKSKVEQALGPESEVGEIVVGFTAIEVRRVRIKGPQGWPAADTLRAQRVVIVPDLRGLLSAQVRVNRITIEEGYVSALRTREGKLRVVPSLLEGHAKQPEKDKSAGPPVAIGAIELRNAVLELYDASVRQPPHKVRLEQLQATVKDVHVPDLAGRTQLQLDGIVKGVQHNGTLALHGWAEIASRNSDIVSKLRGVDLVAFQPYLIKAAETGVRSGTFDLDLDSTVHKNMLHAPGKLTLAGLELESSGGAMSTFMGMPRQGVVNALKDHSGKISLQFTLEGDLNDPKFSLNEAFAKRLGSGFASTLGVSFEGLAKGVGTATQGVGDTVKRLFGK